MSALSADPGGDTYRYNEFAAGCSRAKTWTTGGDVAGKMQNDMPVRIVMGNGTTNAMIAITYSINGQVTSVPIGA